MADTLLANIDDVSGQTFDFVIVGGGTSGLAVASRLTEDPNVSVAVLEVGKARLSDPAILAPGAWLAQLYNPEYDWCYSCVVRPELHGGKPARWARGKSLGGSSAINLAAWNRPQREDIDAFGRLGNKGWNWDMFYEYAKKAERLCPPATLATTGYRDLYNSDSVGHNGPIALSFGGACGHEVLIQQSLEKLGVSVSTDPLSGETTGTWKAFATVDPTSSTRSFSATGYLDLAAGRKNLKILTEAFVTKIIFADGAPGDLAAVGVQFEYSGKLHEVKAAREVILSAGPIQSPQVLEHSGIGDKAILEPLGITVKLHQPYVGTNLQDHVCHHSCVWEMKDDAGITTVDSLKAPGELLRVLSAFPNMDPRLLKATSCFTFLPFERFSENAAAIVQKQIIKFDTESNDLPPGLKEQYEILIDFMKNPRVPDGEILTTPGSGYIADYKKTYATMAGILCHPWSRGTIHITSADPKAPPAIDTGYLREDVDLEILLELFKFRRKVCDTEPFKSKSVGEMNPGPSVVTDEDIRNHIRLSCNTTWHPVGTVSMLPRDKGGVVDHNLKVYGTKNLRVIDSSIVPLIFSTHPLSAVYTIAEIGADIVKGNLIL